MRGGCRGLAPPLRWRGSLLATVCESFDFADPGRSLAVVYTSLCAYADKLLLSACCESLQILTDRTRSFSICFSESLQIHADLPRSIWSGAAIWVPTTKYGGSGEYFSTDNLWFSVTVPVSSCSQGWFWLAGFPWKPPCHGLKCSGPLLTFKVSVVPKLIYWRWVPRNGRGYCVVNGHKFIGDNDNNNSNNNNSNNE